MTLSRPRGFARPAPTIEDVGVGHRRLHILLAEQLLNRPAERIIAGLKEVGGKGVAEGMKPYGAVEAGLARGLLDCLLQSAGAGMITATYTIALIKPQNARRENVLLAPLFFSVGILACQRVGQGGGSMAVSKALLTQPFYFPQMLLERRDERIRQNGDAVLLALAVSNSDLEVVKINVLDAERETFAQPEARAVEQSDDKMMDVIESGENDFDLLAREDNRQPHRTFGSFNVSNFRQLDFEDMVVEKQEGVAGDILG